jgi:hypothetical protein
MVWRAQSNSVQDQKHWTKLQYPYLYFFYYAIFFLVEQCRHYIIWCHVYIQHQTLLQNHDLKPNFCLTDTDIVWTFCHGTSSLGNNFQMFQAKVHKVQKSVFISSLSCKPDK